MVRYISAMCGILMFGVVGCGNLVGGAEVLQSADGKVLAVEIPCSCACLLVTPAMQKRVQSISPVALSASGKTFCTRQLDNLDTASVIAVFTGPRYDQPSVASFPQKWRAEGMVNITGLRCDDQFVYVQVNGAGDEPERYYRYCIRSKHWSPIHKMMWEGIPASIKVEGKKTEVVDKSGVVGQRTEFVSRSGLQLVEEYKSIAPSELWLINGKQRKLIAIDCGFMYMWKLGMHSGWWHSL